MKYLSWSIAAIVLSSVLWGREAESQNISWSKVKGPYAGTVQLLTVDREGDVFAAVYASGMEIYRSTDQGENWDLVHSLLSYGYEAALAVDSSGNIYYGDMEVGLFESSDKGISWSRASLSGGISALSVISGNRICAGGRQTVSISSDSGKTWVTRKLRNDPVEVLSIAEGDSGKIFAGFRAIPPSKTGPGYVGGVYVSSDSGITWEPYGLSSTISSMVYDRNGGKLFGLVNSSTIYSADLRNGVWTQDVSGIPYWVKGISGLFPGRNEEIGAVTNAGVFVYDEVTSSWRSATPAISSDSITAAVYDPLGRTYAGTGFDGVFFLDHSASTWIQCGISPVSITSLGADSSGNLYAGTDNGILELDHFTGRWLRVSDGLGRGRVYRIRESTYDGMLYASTRGGFFFLPDSGNYWIPETKNWTYDFAESSAEGYIATSGGIYRSYRPGGGWIPLESIGLPLTNIYCLALDSKNDLFAGTKFAGVFVSTDDGALWSQTGVNSSLIFYSVNTIEIDSSQRIFVGTDTSGAYYSDDSGINYTSISTISGKIVTSFLVTHPPQYFAGTSDRGVFMSPNCGTSWRPANTGLTDSSVAALLLDRDGYLYAGTTSGLFRSNSIVTDVHESGTNPSGFSLSQNYPNPFNPATTISYSVPSPSGRDLVSNQGRDRQPSAVSHVSLKVYDVLGRLVRTLVNGVRSPGSYRVTFDASGLASGVYFYRLAAGSYVQTRKMVVIR